MRKTFNLFIINLVLVFLQAAFFPELIGELANPSLILAFSFALLLNGEFEVSMKSIFFGGLLIDLLSIKTFGLYTLGHVLVIGLVYFARRFGTKNFVAQIIVFLISYGIYNYIFHQQYLLWQEVITVVLSVVIFGVLRKLGSKFLSETYRIKV
ncbi:rod shape-determining protein MreD [Patescibacteria group bacterium]